MNQKVVYKSHPSYLFMNSILQLICLSLDSESKFINQTFNQSDFLILPFSILLHHMISFHTFILGHFRTKTLKCLLPSMISHHLINHSLRNFQAQCDTTQFITTRLPNCSNLLELNQIHAQIIRSHMLEIYPPAAFCWNNIIRSYVRFNTPYVALNVYLAMSRAGVSPDRYTIPIVLKAVSQVFGVKAGRQVHSVAIRYGLELNEFVECGLISLYCKAGELATARKVFEENPDRKLSSWNAIIGGLAHGGHAKEVVSMFIELKKCGFEPDDITMVSVTSACGSLGDLNLAFQLHKCVFQAKTFEKSDLLMLNSLIDMYGKCGRMDLAKKVFEGTVQRDVSTWTSLINGYAMHGCVKDALDSFGWMRKEGVKPNHVTFIGVLSACVHGGMVEEGKHYFDMMMRVYHLEPRMQHYGVMVDLLGRSGLLDEAKEMVERMPMKANAVIWGALMGACEKYGSVEMGEWVAKHLEELEPWDDGVYVVLSNIYAGAGLWNEVERVREIMKQRRISKLPAFSIL